MTLTHALEAAHALRDELEQEVGRARDERLILRSLDGLKLQASIGQRQAFLGRAQQLQETLRAAQAAAARALGLEDPSAESIQRLLPERGALFASLLGQIRALAATLSELSALNRSLSERALGCTRAYVQALAPPPHAYGRLGASAPAASVAAVSRRA